MRPQLFIFTLEAGSHNSESEKAFSSGFNLKMGLLSTSSLQAAASKYHVRVNMKPMQTDFCFLFELSTTAAAARDNRDGHLLFEVEMYLKKGCIML